MGSLKSVGGKIAVVAVWEVCGVAFALIGQAFGYLLMVLGGIYTVRFVIWPALVSRVAPGTRPPEPRDPRDQVDVDNIRLGPRDRPPW